MKKSLFALLGIFVALSALLVSCDSGDGELLTPCEIYITATEGGSVAFEKPSTTLKKFNPGSVVIVVATADEDYEFAGWLVEGNETPVSTDAIYTFIASEDLTLVARFYEAVDLGLSVKWATCNVGATSPEGYGDYFAWGETTTKSNYSWSTYKYSNDTVDNKTTLGLADDAAHVNWGGSWRMPTSAEQQELFNCCTCTWTTQNGVNGYRVTGPNGNSIFLPAAGCRNGSEVYSRGALGGYWSSSMYSYNHYDAFRLLFDSSRKNCNYDSRYYGLTVRPVTDK